MDCVIDAGALSRIERINRLDLLSKVYSTIYAPPAVLMELEPHYPTKEFLKSRVIPITFKSEKERRRFDSLVRRWRKKVDLDDIADLEVFIGYKFFTNADEALYANKEAETKLSPYGKVRDICRLYELAEYQGIFSRKESIKYLESLLDLDPPYRPAIIKNLLENLTDY